MTDTIRLRLDRVRLAALLAAVIGGGLCVAALVVDPRIFFQSYLLGVVFWVGASLGCAAMLMIYHLTGGRWGDQVGGIFQAGVTTIPMMALLFIPVLLGISSLYMWSHPDLVRVEPILMHKSQWLNVPRFVGGTIFYFVVWIIGGHFLVRWGDLRRSTGDPVYARWLGKLSGAGMVIYVLTVSFAAFDWIMSLEPLWYSTVYGAIMIAGQGLLAVAIITVTYILLTSEGGLGRQAQRGILYDLGNLLLLTVVFWAYMQFSQLLIIYYGNVPEETVWYVPRMRHYWGEMGALLIGFHFAVPLALLLSRTLKQQARALLPIACGLIAMQFLSDMWVTIPSFARTQWWPVGLDLAAVVGIGGLWVAMFTTQLKRRPMWAITPETSPPQHPKTVPSHG